MPGLPHYVFFGDVVYEPGGTYGPRLQTIYQLFFVTSGHARVEVDGHKYDVGEGQMALFKPGHVEFFQFSKETKTHHRWCHLGWQLPRKVGDKVERLPLRAPLSKRTEHLCDLGLSLQHDPHARKPLLQHLGAATFWEFVGTQAQKAPSAPRATLPAVVARVQTYIAQHYPDDLSLAKLGVIAAVSPEHLTRLFRKHLGTTPMHHLWRVRAEQGVSYLHHTGLSVEQVAYRCGFKTAAHFSRRVKARYGLTPGQIRADHWLTG